jgi:excisionase family DNA binding protein
MFNHEKLLHTIDRAAEQVAQGRTAIYQLISDGRLKAVKAGRRTLITDESLKAYVASLPAANIHMGGKRPAAERRAAA